MVKSIIANNNNTPILDIQSYIDQHSCIRPLLYFFLNEDVQDNHAIIISLYIINLKYKMRHNGLRNYLGNNQNTIIILIKTRPTTQYQH